MQIPVKTTIQMCKNNRMGGAGPNSLRSRTNLGDIRGNASISEVSFVLSCLSHFDDFALFKSAAESPEYPIIKIWKDIVALLNLGQPLRTNVAT
jgi:hypothetical protein